MTKKFTVIYHEDGFTDIARWDRLGSFDTKEEAIAKMKKHHKHGEFERIWEITNDVTIYYVPFKPKQKGMVAIEKIYYEIRCDD